MPKRLDKKALIGEALLMDAQGVPIREQAERLGITHAAFIKRMQRWGFKRHNPRGFWKPTGAEQ